MMGRMEACRQLSQEDCEEAMEGIIFEGFKPLERKSAKGMIDLGEAPQAYKTIEGVMQDQADLATPMIKLKPIAVLKG